MAKNRTTFSISALPHDFTLFVCNHFVSTSISIVLTSVVPFLAYNYYISNALFDAAQTLGKTPQHSLFISVTYADVMISSLKLTTETVRSLEPFIDNLGNHTLERINPFRLIILILLSYLATFLFTTYDRIISYNDRRSTQNKIKSLVKTPYIIYPFIFSFITRIDSTIHLVIITMIYV
ncbi:hypothetical protein J9B83_15460 [Marinomonas sp. A79]|uniref:Uncharacterized protein n=1 Tax=Marinomonas vulgaris TaxID=2823372 RepID=A0ABS5HF99_9GAMM|nr:hypothetical protein [Marinomonas vulgaris]MBR7890291.1 hypothetical protein [Marinomonas vulgaris]